MKAPGANTKTRMVLASSGRNLQLNTLPLPRISLMAPRMVRAKVNPSPMPAPSSIDGHTGFFDANASARPSTMQFTTISGMNSPSVSYMSRTYAL